MTNSIVRRDDTGSFGKTWLQITADIPSDFDHEISRLDVKISNLPTMSYDNPTFPLNINLTSDQTVNLKDKEYIVLIAYDENGLRETCKGRLEFNTRSENQGGAGNGGATCSAKFTITEQDPMRVRFAINALILDYELLTNKPQINSVELIGNKSLADLGITTEIDTRISTHNTSTEAHPYIQGLITAEATARAAADTTLQTNITAEATTRAQADVDLQNDINTRATKQALLTEINDRQEADTDIQEEINTLTETVNTKVTKNADIIGATHTKITYDKKGLVTGGTNLTESDIPSLHLAKITDVTATATELNYVDGVTSNIQTQLDNKLPNTTKYGADLSYSDSKLQLKDQDGNLLGNSVTIKSSPAIDNSTITKNTNDELQAVNLVGLTSTITELNYSDGVTSNIQTQLNAKQATMSAGTGISITNNAISINQVATEGYNISITGTLTTLNGVISGFSSTDYATVPVQFNPSDDSWEIVYKFTTASTKPSRYRYILGSLQGSNSIVIGQYSTGVLTYWLSSQGGSTWDLCADQRGTIVLSDNTAYTVSVAYDGQSVYTMSISTDDGVSWTQDTTLTSSSDIYGGTIYLGSPYDRSDDTCWQGSIDLNNCRMKIGRQGEIWAGFSITENIAKATENLYGLVKPDNSTITISNGVISSTGGGSSRLVDLTDVNISSPANNQVLKYNSTTQKWENGTGGAVEIDNSTITKNASGQIQAVGLVNLTATVTELNYTDGVTSNIQTQLNSKVEDLSDLGITVTATELNYTDGVTSNIQTQLNAKVEDLSDLGVTATASEINVLDGITATTTELNYVDGVTSSIQTQLNNKISTSDKGIASGVATLDTNGKVPLTQINDALLGNVKYMGLWDASTGTAPSASPTKGNYWITSTAGTFSSKYYEVGDWIICNATDPSVVWDIVRNTDAVSSVEGRTGNVTVISDTSGSGATTYTWSADKLNTEFDKKVTGNTAIIGATHSKITYDSKGLVTSGEDLTLSDLSITATASEINVLDGITASTAELNILDGITATTSELNYTDGVTSNIQTQLDNKSLVTIRRWS